MVLDSSAYAHKDRYGAAQSCTAMTHVTYVLTRHAIMIGVKHVLMAPYALTEFAAV